MATTTQTDKFKTDVLNGVHNFAGTGPKTYKMLLIKPSPSGTYDKTLQNVGTPGAGTPSVTNVGTDEVANGNGYTTGGVAMSGVSVTLRTDTATVDWSVNPSWTSSTFSAICGVLYETTSGSVVAIYDFGVTVSVTNGTLTLTLPTAGVSTSMVRIA